MIRGMGDALRRFLVAMVTLAFLGGTLERSAFGLTADDPCPLSRHTHTMAHQPLHSGHLHTGHEATHKQMPAKNQGTKCFCYGIASFSIFPVPLVNMAFQITSVSFPTALKTLNGRSIVLDPGIPKRIA
jgi:hypothetical protein